MKHYILTLLKDLPDVKAGFKVKVSEEEIKENDRWHSDDLTYSQNKMADEVFHYRDNKDWVSWKFDVDYLVKIKCPKCDKIGMFKFKDEELEYKSDDGVSSWYENGGLECPLCNHKVYVYSTCVKKKVHW